MEHLDTINRWLKVATGRTVDQHAADPIPAAAHLPEAAHRLRRARTELLLAIDRLRTLLINDDDLAGPVNTVTGPLDRIAELARDYRHARNWIDLLINDQTRTEYAQANPGRRLQRRYVNPGDTVLIVLPHTENCRRQQIAGRPVRVHIGPSDAELDLMTGPGRLRLSHPDAGIYHDPIEGALYILQPPDSEPTPSDS